MEILLMLPTRQVSHTIHTSVPMSYPWRSNMRMRRCPVGRRGGQNTNRTSWRRVVSSIHRQRSGERFSGTGGVTGFLEPGRPERCERLPAVGQERGDLALVDAAGPDAAAIGPEQGDAMDEKCADNGCPVARALEILDGRWTMLVIRDLLGGTKRFSELRNSLAGISPKTLTDRLRSLEENGLVRRVIHAEVPPRVEYTLTDTGLGLEPAIRALGAWGATVASAPAGTPTTGVK